MKLNNKGITLVEIVVALAIVAIVMATVGGILFSSFSVFNNIAQSNEDKFIGDSVYNWVSEKIILAEDVKIINEQSIVLDNENTITVNNGKLFSGDKNIYGDAFYNGKSISISIKKYSTESVSVYVYVWKNGNNTYNTGSVMKLLNYDFSA